jgi:apolipoprotein N-acyltransferase
VLLASTGVAVAVRRRAFEPAAVGFLVPLLLLAVGARYAHGAPRWGDAAPVRLLQPNIPNLVAFDPAVVERNLEKVLRMSAAACREPGTLVVWPESAAWPYSFGRDLGFTLRVNELLRGGCQLLLNSPQSEDERTYNSALLLNPDGAVSRYDKRHLVPWGEFVPLADLLPFVGRLARAAGDFAAASEVRLLPWGDDRIGTAICFESVFADEVAELVREGATVLVTLSNDAWYGDTAAPWQLLRSARFRAAESRRPLLRAAITGVSAVIDARGEVVDMLGVGEEGVLAAKVAGRRDLSPYSRRPWLVPALAGALAILAIIPGIRVGRDERPTDPSAVTSR